MYITQVKLRKMVAANEIASKQGFNLIGIESTDELTIYNLICRYGDTDEIYTLTVDTCLEKIVEDSVTAV